VWIGRGKLYLTLQTEYSKDAPNNDVIPQGRALSRRSRR
jgi:hypothetical protein